MEFHPIANLFPLLEGKAFADFVEDVRLHGLLDPIVRHEGKILDGRNRWRACQEAGVPPRFVDFDGDDPAAFAFSHNIQRFQYTASQLAMVGAEMRKWYDEQAKERQKGGQGGKLLMETVPEAKGTARDRVGKVVGVSGKSIDAATKVIETGTPELKAAVKAGKIPVSTAALIAAKPDDEQRAELANPKPRKRYRKAAASQPASPVNGDPEAATPPRVTVMGVEVVGKGVSIAHEAINLLARIPRNDQLLKRGLQVVADWVRRKLKEIG